MQKSHRSPDMIDRILALTSSREYIKSSALPVVLYGMGNGADRVLDEFQAHEIPVIGVTASDDFVRGQTFRGFTVRKLSEFPAPFILCPCFGTQRKEVIEHIRNIIHSFEKNGCEMIYPVVPVIGEGIIDREFIINHSGEINACCALLDEKSKEIYENCIKFLFTGRPEYIFSADSEKEEIFTTLMRPGKSESFLDIGAYRGDTVAEFLSFSGGNYSKITALEPDSKTFTKLRENLSDLKNTYLLNAAASGFDGKTEFTQSNGRMSKIGKGQEADCVRADTPIKLREVDCVKVDTPYKGREVDCVKVDTLYNENKFTYIKIDAEGEERNIILGAEKCLKEMKPKLNIALYHRSEDFFALPLLINSINPDYHFAVRKHPYLPCWDFNLYCY